MPKVFTSAGIEKAMSHITDLITDLTPQYGGAMDTNAFSINLSEGADVASASSCDIWTNNDGNGLHITGTTTIDDFATAPRAGATRFLIFDGAVQLTDGINMDVPGGTYTTATGDRVFVYAETTTISKLIVWKADGTPLAGGGGDMVLANAQTVTGAKTFDSATLLLNDTDSAFDLELGSTSTITAANKTLIFDVNNANRTLTIGADVTLDQGVESGASPIFAVTNMTGSAAGIDSDATTHAAADGSSHTFIDQDVTLTGNPRFATVELGAVADTTISRVSAGVAAVEGSNIIMASNKLDALSATSSAELRTVISDETGTGGLVFATSPTLVTPVLGTPSSGALGSCTAYEGTAMASTGEAGASKFLREDGDGTCSWQAAAGASLPIIGKSLGHHNASTTAIYARLNLDPVRQSVDRAVDAMLKAGGLESEESHVQKTGQT